MNAKLDISKELINAKNVVKDVKNVSLQLNVTNALIKHIKWEMVLANAPSVISLLMLITILFVNFVMQTVEFVIIPHPTVVNVKMD